MYVLFDFLTLPKTGRVEDGGGGGRGGLYLAIFLLLIQPLSFLYQNLPGTSFVYFPSKKMIPIYIQKSVALKMV